ncbi:MAG: LutC/YkgG family protein [Longimicrobiales bacterium]
MSSRDLILRAIRRSKPVSPPLPEAVAVPARVPGTASESVLRERFTSALEEAGARVAYVEGRDFGEVVREYCPDAQRIVSSFPGLVAGASGLGPDADPAGLADVDLFVCEAEFGVAENGAVWLPEYLMRVRAAPFIAQHLAVLLEEGMLVSDMHEAYERIRVNRPAGAEPDGYGVFVAGPSKTADIEQSLVIGAHGPRSLTVLLF